MSIRDNQMVRVVLTTIAHTEKGGGKAKTTPETKENRGLDAHMKRNYVLILKELDKLCPRQNEIILITSNSKVLMN